MFRHLSPELLRQAAILAGCTAAYGSRPRLRSSSHRGALPHSRLRKGEPSGAGSPHGGGVGDQRLSSRGGGNPPPPPHGAARPTAPPGRGGAGGARAAVHAGTAHMRGAPGGVFRPADLSPGGDRRHNTEVRWRPRRRRQRKAAAAPRPLPGGGCASSPATCGARRGLRSGRRYPWAPARRRGAPPGRPPALSRRSGGCGRGSPRGSGPRAAPGGVRATLGGLPGRPAAGAGDGLGLGQPALRRAVSLPAGDGRGLMGPGEAPRGLCGELRGQLGWEMSGRRMGLSPNAGKALKRFTAAGTGWTWKKVVFGLSLVFVVGGVVLKWKGVHSHLNNWRRGSMFVRYFVAVITENAARVKSKVCVWAFSPPLFTDNVKPSLYANAAKNILVR